MGIISIVNEVPFLLNNSAEVLDFLSFNTSSQLTSFEMPHFKGFTNETYLPTSYMRSDFSKYSSFWQTDDQRDTNTFVDKNHISISRSITISGFDNSRDAILSFYHHDPINGDNIRFLRYRASSNSVGLLANDNKRTHLLPIIGYTSVYEDGWSPTDKWHHITNNSRYLAMIEDNSNITINIYGNQLRGFFCSDQDWHDVLIDTAGKITIPKSSVIDSSGNINLTLEVWAARKETQSTTDTVDNEHYNGGDFKGYTPVYDTTVYNTALTANSQTVYVNVFNI